MLAVYMRSRAKRMKRMEPHLQQPATTVSQGNTTPRYVSRDEMFRNSPFAGIKIKRVKIGA